MGTSKNEILSEVSKIHIKRQNSKIYQYFLKYYLVQNLEEKNKDFNQNFVWFAFATFKKQSKLFLIRLTEMDKTQNKSQNSLKNIHQNK